MGEWRLKLQNCYRTGNRGSQVARAGEGWSVLSGLDSKEGNRNTRIRRKRSLEEKYDDSVSDLLSWRFRRITRV